MVVVSSILKVVSTSCQHQAPICKAAEHAGFVTNASNGNVLLDVIVHNPKDFQSTLYFQYTRTTGENFLSSIPETREYYSIKLSSEDIVVQTISGAPAALRSRSCGYKDSVPAQEAIVRSSFSFSLLFKTIVHNISLSYSSNLVQYTHCNISICQ